MNKTIRVKYSKFFREPYLLFGGYPLKDDCLIIDIKPEARPDHEKSIRNIQITIEYDREVD